jgi:hypothetical protein
MENDAAISTYIVAFGSAAAGALVGSLATYLLGLRQQKQDEDNRRHGALINTQFALFSQWKVVDGIKTNHLEPLRNEANRFTKLRTTLFIKAPLSVPLSELAFIANSNDPNLIQEIADAEQDYLKSMLVLDLFNHYRAEFEKNHPPIPGTFNNEKGSGQTIATKFEIEVGNYYLSNLYKQVDLASPNLLKTIEKIAIFVKQNFKGKKSIRIAEAQDAKKEQVAA